jgi:hypothetical protein
MRSRSCPWVCGAGLLAIAAALGAQTTGQIRGRVLDPGGAGLGGVSVLVRSASGQGNRSSETSPDGAFVVPALPPGDYRLEFRREGFAPVEREARVRLDATVAVEVKLQPAVSEEVTVRGKTPPMDLRSSTTGTSYSARTIASLPVGRNYSDIVRANPGVDVDRGDRQGRSAALAIRGSTSAENVYLIDGIDTTNVIRGFQGKAIPREFIQEVEVKSGGYEAEYGRATGGIINVVTKSGGNAFHGGAFVRYFGESFRAGDKFNADDADTRPRTPGQSATDAGAELGGFVVRDRLWFFGAYNRVETETKLSNATGPSAGVEFPQKTTDNLWSGKLTWNASPGTTVVATAFADPSVVDGAILHADALIGRRDIGAADYGLRATQVFGTWGLGTLQVSRHQDRYQLKGSTPEENAIRVTDYTQPGYPTTGGLGQINGYSDYNTGRRDAAQASFEAFLGGHDVKLGGGYAVRETDSVNRFTGGQTVSKFYDEPTGLTYYQHVFLSDAFSADPVPIAVNEAKPRSLDSTVYLEDAWSPSSNVTVNAGLRWDGTHIQDFRHQTVVKLDRQWQPRVGVIWDPSRVGAWKVSGSYGRYFYDLPTNLNVREYGQQIVSQTFNFDPVDTTQADGVPGHPTALQQGGVFAEPADRNLQGTYQDEFMLGVEHAVDASFTLGLTGIYKRLGNAIEDRCDLNPADPGNMQNTCANINLGSSEKWGSGDFGWCDGYNEGGCYPAPAPATPAARRLFRGIELLARKSFGDRYWIQASYLYSSLRGNYDGAIYEEIGQTNPGSNIDFDYPAQYPHAYGNLYLDRPHQFRFDGWARTPIGLDVGLQFWVRSGVPIDKLDSAWQQHLGSTRFLIARGTAGRTPTELDANLLVSYPFTIRPVTVTPQIYVYNLLNRQTVTYQEGCYICGPYGSSTYYNVNYKKGDFRSDPRLLMLAVKADF